MNHAQYKAQLRRAVHGQFAVPVSVTKKGDNAPLEKSLTARLHNRVASAPDPTGRGGATILEDVTRVIFNREQLAAQGVSLENGDKVFFPDFNVTVTLNTRDRLNGPVTDKWTVQTQPQRR